MFAVNLIHNNKDHTAKAVKSECQQELHVNIYLTCTAYMKKNFTRNIKRNLGHPAFMQYIMHTT